MGYGYLILAVKSEQDNFLVGNPQFTYFKAVYRRHTNFAINFQKVNFPTDTNNCAGKLLSVNIPKVGDLLHRAYLNINIIGDGSVEHSAPSIYNYIEYVEIYIGDQLIDRHTGSWLELYSSYYENSDKIPSLNRLTKVPQPPPPASTGPCSTTITTPLRFWFNNHIGNSLPLIALQYSNVKLNIKLNDPLDIWNSSSTNSNKIQILSMNLLIENIYLDQEERRAFTTNKHEYLITQLQTSLSNNIRNFAELYGQSEFVEDIRFKIPLRFRFPVKELFWVIQNHVANVDGEAENNIGLYKFNYWLNFVPGSDQMNVCTIELNGKELMDELPAKFFRDVQRFQYHSGIVDHGSYSYSFSIDPENNQPSGSLNFSKLENAFLKIGFPRDPPCGECGKVSHCQPPSPTTDKCHPPDICISVYAVNYNVLRIMSGVGAVEFIN